MNRRERRAAARRRPPAPLGLPLAAAVRYRCPDCLSENGTPTTGSAGVWRVEIRHDDTCPTYRALVITRPATYPRKEMA